MKKRLCTGRTSGGEEKVVHNPTNSHLAHPRSARSAKPALSPYFLDEVAMTRSEVLLARYESDSGSIEQQPVRSPELTAVLAA